MKLLAPVLAAAGVAVCSGCSSDEDCGLLGDCIADACVCDVGWGGPNCASLNLLPAPVDAGLRQAVSSNWCGTILPAADAGTYTMLSSDMHGCGLGVWESGSQVIEAVSTTGPLGPYTPSDAVAIHAEAHNPQAIQSPDGTWLLFDSYGGPDSDCPATANYTTCSGGGLCASKTPPEGGRNWWIFHTSPTPSGPWSPVNTTVDFPCFSKNLTPSPAFAKNGSLFLVFHCDADSSHQMGDLVMVRSDDWATAPFERVNDAVWRLCGNNASGSACVEPHPEDPFLWLRTSPATGEVSYHVVMHNTPRGIHAFSRDGTNFTLQQALDGGGIPQAPFVYTEVVAQLDGSNLTAGRRERPWLLLDGAGAPLVLVTAMQANGVHGTFTHAQAVGV